MIVYGKWSLNADISDAAYGYLEIGEFGDCILYINDEFPKGLENQMFDVEIQRYSHIYGITNEQQFIVLEDCFETSRSMGSKVNVNISPNVVYIFDHQQFEAMEFQSLVVEFDKFGYWLSERNVSVNREEGKVAVIASPKIIWEGMLSDYHIQFDHMIHTEYKFQNSVTITSDFRSLFYFNYKRTFKEIEIRDLVELVGRFNVLLNILNGEDIYTNKMILEGENCKCEVIFMAYFQAKKRVLKNLVKQSGSQLLKIILRRSLINGLTNTISCKELRGLFDNISMTMVVDLE